jgi:hypothetical protein
VTRQAGGVAVLRVKVSNVLLSSLAASEVLQTNVVHLQSCRVLGRPSRYTVSVARTA